MLRRFFIACSSFVMIALPLVAGAQTPAGQAPPAQEGFVPITELPPSQQMPAAPFVIAAYAFIWLALMIYLWSIWRRLGKVEQEMRALEQRSARGGHR